MTEVIGSGIEALKRLAEEGPMGPYDLQKELMSYSSANATLRGLEERGLTDRPRKMRSSKGGVKHVYRINEYGLTSAIEFVGRELNLNRAVNSNPHLFKTEAELELKGLLLKLWSMSPEFVVWAPAPHWLTWSGCLRTQLTQDSVGEDTADAAFESTVGGYGRLSCCQD